MDFDENFGRTIMFFLGNQLNDKTTLVDLKTEQNIKAFPWGRQDHQDDINIPMFVIDSIYNKELKQTIVFA